jgi:hypothetical protein
VVQVIECLPSKYPSTTLNKTKQTTKEKYQWPGTLAHIYNPATLEAEIRKIMVQSQPGQKVSKTSISTNRWHVFVIPAR